MIIGLMDVPIRYACARDGVRIPYWTLGRGRPFIWMPALLSHVAVEWQIGRRATFERMAQKYLLVRYDSRGRGLSDREPADVSLQAMQLDLEAVLDDLALSEVVLYAPAHAGPVAIAFAAAHPERVSHLILQNSFARAKDYFSTPLMRSMLPLVERDWQLFSMVVAQARLGWTRGYAAKESAALLQDSMTPQFFMRLVETQDEFDVTEELSKIRVPTLVIHRPGLTVFDPSTSGFLASRIPGARLTILRDSEEDPAANANDQLLAEISSFLSQTGDGDEDESKRTEQPSTNSSLSRRELQTLRLLALGYRNNDIAKELDVSVHTIERHIANMYSKIGAHGRVEAATYAFRHGLLQ